ncbi:hypothetical protein HOH87_03840 [bacterium]|nr:hypothetical protein [bacterium]
MVVIFGIVIASSDGLAAIFGKTVWSKSCVLGSEVGLGDGVMDFIGLLGLQTMKLSCVV